MLRMQYTLIFVVNKYFTLKLKLIRPVTASPLLRRVFGR